MHLRNPFPIDSHDHISSNFCQALLQRSAGGYATVYKKAEQLFARLAKVAVQFKDWTALGYLDLDALCSEHLREVRPGGFPLKN